MKKYIAAFERLEASLLNSDASLSQNERKEIASIITENKEGQSFELTNWVKKVAFASYKTLDSEVIALHDKGYNDPVIFEATLVSAHTAAKQILTKGLDLLK